MSEPESRPPTAHVLETFLVKETAIRELFAAVEGLEREIDGWLMPTIRRRREELERLQRRIRAVEVADHGAARLTHLERQVADQQQEIDRLRGALEHARRELAIVYRSRSWRLTAPLRAVYDVVWRRLGRAAGSTGATGDGSIAR